eukprot:SAG11_NODE_1249_length_5393_cov_4.349641_7_plen_187_part_00
MASLPGPREGGGHHDSEGVDVAAEADVVAGPELGRGDRRRHLVPRALGLLLRRLCVKNTQTAAPGREGGGARASSGARARAGRRGRGPRPGANWGRGRGGVGPEMMSVWGHSRVETVAVSIRRGEAVPEMTSAPGGHALKTFASPKSQIFHLPSAGITVTSLSHAPFAVEKCHRKAEGASEKKNDI